MMQNSYIPKASMEDFCEGLDLCGVRKSADGTILVGIKDLQGNVRQEALEKIINSENYDGKKIVRVYSSGHVFLSNDHKQVFLITTEKDGKRQHQFTGGSPIEEENKEVILRQGGIYSFNIEKVRANARLRTENRTGVKVLEEYNRNPLVDWVLMENQENGENYYRLVCLMHFVVKLYDGTLSHTGKEYAIDSAWYNIDTLPELPNIAPNAHIVSKKALEFVSNPELSI